MSDGNPSRPPGPGEGELAGRVALVTGAGRGIGRATALALAELGAHVMGVARTREQLDALAASHPNISAYAVSLDSAEGCRAAVEETYARLGPVGILVSNAGTGSSAERPLWEQDPEVWRASLALNLDAPFELMRLTAPGMIAAGGGRIIVVASTAGLFGGPAMTAYCAAKHGVIGLVRAAALDLAPHAVTCNAVNPGWVRTEMAETSARLHAERQGVTVDEIWARRAAGYAAGRLPTAEEVADTTCFLAGPRSGGVSGETVNVTLGDPW
jgi:NAD(P)-dependent dehydrogenase (short-subunit alcohol dehydrogenase family)